MLMFRTASSFTVVLNRWVEFLLWLYERDQLTVHVLIQLHSVTDGLLRALGDSASRNQSLANLNGVHLSLARVVDQYLVLLEQVTSLSSHEVSFLVEGRHNKDYYYRKLLLLFERATARISKLVQHNSPWDLGVTFAPGGGALLFMALFLATRTRIELQRIGQKLSRPIEGSPQQPSEAKPASQHKKRRTSANAAPQTILALDFGASRAMRSTPNFRLRAYLPGNLVADLQLDIASQSIAKLRKTIKDLL
jgi:hypothetical protein